MQTFQDTSIAEHDGSIMIISNCVSIGTSDYGFDFTVGANDRIEMINCTYYSFEPVPPFDALPLIVVLILLGLLAALVASIPKIPNAL